ncbi:MAG: hypothetical protein J2P25_09120 [Nocardiopsaceae bacterium]|nr:hypothetical protein [Nocardiopsaceae bacterium]
MKVTAAAMSSNWRADHLGPWERYRYVLEGGRVVTVSRGTEGRWTWGMWSAGDEGQCLDMALDEFDTAADAMADASREIVERAYATDEQLAGKTMIEEYRAPLAFRLVAVGDGKACVHCRSEITLGIAAEEAEGGRWLWCGSCASRNPDSVIAGTMMRSA